MGASDGALSREALLDNVVAAAFGNASAGPTAAKVFQHLSSRGGASHRERIAAEVAALGSGQLSTPDLDKLPYTDAGVSHSPSPTIGALINMIASCLALSERPWSQRQTSFSYDLGCCFEAFPLNVMAGLLKSVKL